MELPGAGPTDGGALVLGRYRLGSRLGSGGFGTVFAARDERLDRIVAVKVIPAGAAADGLDARGRREALAAARLDHPGIVSVYDAGEDGEARYVISELVQGATLDKLQRDGALSDRDVLRIGLTLAAALAHAHDRGVIHRDVKPQNVIVPEVPDEGRAAAKLTDFGVAHLAGDEPLTMTGDVVGTLAYMAPEQAAGERIDDRADLYALALVLYEALAGVNPVRAGSPAATARRVGTVLPPLAAKRPELPRRLCAAIDRALRPDPEDRGELEDLEDAFEDALLDVSDEGGTIAPLPLERRGGALLPGWASRPLAALAAGALAAVVAASLGRPPAEPAAAGAAVAAAVLVLPRLGWIAAAVVAVAALAGERPGVAALTALAALAAVLLARRAPLAWSLPAAAPVLGLAGLAGAYPALAGRATRAPTRAGLGAAGAVWVLLAQPALGRALVLGMRQPEPRWDGSAGRALQDAVWPLLSSGAALLLVVWALGALVLPWLVRGRVLALDVVAAAAWAAALAGATAALAERTVGPGPGVLGGALLAAGVAVLLPRARRSHGIL
ncbi:MAG: eukaryotic-like serine/threonine-protein kinase [Solirubrobacteraceae bacterium]|nr:eukaryotic-like serine/threonine-protein kinase [Solirubrobacteraceae bacterium]